ncbi:GNAT family N-acetyltransferase [Methyloceanibacter superfactus]|nr:GNAT family N-acetyltransferase [Methyloceanibacter superfactus]
MTSGPFSAAADLILNGDPGRACLRPMAPAACAALGRAIVAVPPWSEMPYSAEAITGYLVAVEDGARRYRIEVDGMTAGAVAVRYPWLRGVYLELLALLPEFQNQGIGSAVLDWLAREALHREARNLWACASSFNEAALRFYARHGFAETAVLHGLVADGFDEILLRKFPLGSVPAGG